MVRIIIAPSGGAVTTKPTGSGSEVKVRKDKSTHTSRKSEEEDDIYSDPFGINKEKTKRNVLVNAKAKRNLSIVQQPQVDDDNKSEKEGARIASAAAGADPSWWFCYLMIQLGGACKNEAKIIVTCEIYYDSYQHNTGLINDKGTKAAKGSWMPEMAIGPFDLKEEAETFKRLWMQESRGIIPRRQRGIELVKAGHAGPTAKCYDKRLIPVPLNEWLVENHLECLVIPEKRLEELFRVCGISDPHSDGTSPTCSI